MKNTVRNLGAGGSLQAAHEALAQTEQRIIQLQDERARKLADADGDYLAEVDALDRLIETQERAVRTHHDRISVLNAELQRQAQEVAEGKHLARVAATEKSLTERDVIAAKLETAIHDMGRLYFELIDKNLEISRQWGMSNNAIRIGALTESIISREVSHALFAVGRPRGGVSRLPAPGTVGLGITGDTSVGGLSERVTAASSALLDMIRAVPTNLPEDEAA